MEYRIGICDDEISTCSYMEMAIHNYMQWHGYKGDIYVWDSAATFIDELTNKIDLDLLFLDIKMPEINGVDVGMYIREQIDDSGMKIVYMSSATDYALQLFKVHPYDFLVKPFNDKVIFDILDKLIEADEKNANMFMFRKRGDKVSVRFSDIIYFQSDKKHIKIIMTNEREEAYIGKLSDEICKIPCFFASIGKSYIINLNHLYECHAENVIMDNGHILGISKMYRDTFGKSMAQFRIYGGAE